MTKPKRPAPPADITALKSLINEQAVQIASLTEELRTAKADAEKKGGYLVSSQKETERLRVIVEGIHDLIDTIPGVIPRETKGKNNWGGETTKETDILIRLASMFGAIHKKAD